MRIVKTMADVQKALNELFDWKQSFGAFPRGSLDLRGNRITNAGAAKDKNDYTILSQLPTLTQDKQPQSFILYTITFNPPDGSSSGTVSPPFRIGIGRSGSLYQAWVMCNVAPTSDFKVNYQYKGVDILPTDLTISSGSLSAKTSTFVIPTPFMAQDNPVTMILRSDNTAQGVTGGIVIQTSPGVGVLS